MKKKEQFHQDVLQNKKVSVDSCGSCTAGKPIPMGLFFHCAEPRGGLEASHGELGEGALTSCQGDEKSPGR